MSKSTATASPPKFVKLGEGTDGLPLSACRVCGSTEREPYTERAAPQVIDGKQYRWLRTRCTACNQARVDRVVGDAPEAPTEPEPTTAGTDRMED